MPDGVDIVERRSVRVNDAQPVALPHLKGHVLICVDRQDKRGARVIARPGQSNLLLRCGHHPGAVPPGQSFSLQDDGTSLAGNPAGLGFVSGFEADFLHNGYYGSRYGDANALDLAFGTGPLTLALGFDWLNQADPSGSTSSYRRTSIGGALRLGELSIGVVHRGFSGVDLSQAWDFGALARPTRWLSLGAAALDANRPAMLPRQWIMSAAVRPWRERRCNRASSCWDKNRFGRTCKAAEL